jgi:hypothetical protein
METGTHTCRCCVWGGLHYRSTVEDTSKWFPQIARNVGKHYFLADLKHRGKKHNDH